MNQNELDKAIQVWDQAADSFDEKPDHGLRDADVRAAWAGLLRQWLPAAGQSPARMLDVGCGTGSLSVLLAEMGYEVVGIDFSARMLARAREKAAAAGQAVDFRQMNAAQPQGLPEPFNAIICRHLLWALPEPAAVLRRWVKLLAPGGRLLLVEGCWQPGGGLHATQVQAMLPQEFTQVHTVDLSGQSELWGQAVDDERYLIVGWA